MAAIRDVFSAITTALLSPRVVLFVWLLILVPALVVVLPRFEEYDAALSQHPGAGFLLDQALDADFARQHGTLPLLGATLFVLLASVFLAGGVLSIVGVRSTRGTLSEFLGESGRLFLRNLRVLGVGIMAALLLGWGIDAARYWLGELAYGVDPGSPFVFDWLPVRWAHLAWVGSLAAGFAFLCLVFASKVAMARLALHNRRSAILAWGIAIGKSVRQPLRVALTVGLLTAAWTAGAHLLGGLTARFLEVEQNLWLGLLFGQLSMLWGAVILVATLLAARQFAISHAAVADPEAREPIVEVPRAVPQKTGERASVEV